MRFRTWVLALIEGFCGVMISERSTTWQRRKLRGPLAVEGLESRVLLTGVESSPFVTAFPGDDTRGTASVSPSVEDSGWSAAETTGGGAQADGFPAFGDVSGTGSGGEIDGGDVSGGEPGGELGGNELFGGDPGGEIGGVDISGDIGGDVSGDVSGDVGGEIGGSDLDGAGQLSIVTIDPEAWEGPYHQLRNDEGRFQLQRTMPGPALRVTIQLGGTAETGDYLLSTDSSEWIPPSVDRQIEVTLEEGAPARTIFVRALMDPDYESPEIVEARIVGVQGGQVLINQDPATVMIIDQQPDLDITSAGHPGVLDEVEEDDPGADIRLNNDHDAGRDVNDMIWYSELLRDGYVDSAAFLDEDDFLNLSINNHLVWPNDIGPSEGVEYSLQFSPLLIRIWEYRGAEGGIIRAHLIGPDEPINIHGDFRVEGIGSGPGTISVQWQSISDPEFKNQSDALAFTVWHVDLDIDSDNTYQGTGEPDRDSWEDKVEYHPYGLGKLIFPSESYTPDEHSPDENRFTGLWFDFATSNESEDAQAVTFTWEGKSGKLQLWSMPSNVSGGLIDAPLEGGGHRITMGRRYTIRELNTALFDGRIKRNELWAEGSNAQFALDKQKSIEVFGRPDDRIDFHLEVYRSGAWGPILSDTVKYLVVNPGTFFPTLQWGPRLQDTDLYDTPIVLRDAIASGLVYKSNADGRDYALQLQSPEDMLALGIPSELVGFIARGGGVDGLRVAIYRDYAAEGAPLVLAFAGTNDVADAIEDFVQAFGHVGKQYPIAMRIAAELARLPGLIELGVRVTGHSLGGGLASAASVASGISANTFNSAGLHPNTLYVEGDQSKAQLYPKIRERFDEAASTGLVHRWYLEYDVVTFLQGNSGLPDAIGVPHRMTGPPVHPIEQQLIADLADRLRASFHGDTWQSLLTFVASNADWFDLFSDVTFVLFPSHVTRYYYYGLMVRRAPASSAGAIDWDIYGEKDLSFY